MPLICECIYDEDGAYWYYDPPRDFICLGTTRRKRCSSCKKLIDIGAICLKFHRWRNVRTDVEEAIHGDTVPLAPLWMCEPCGEQYLNLEALGYCIDPTENMMELLAEYQEMTGWSRVRYS